MNSLEGLFNKLERTLLFKNDSEWANERYLKLIYKKVTGKNLNLENPKTFNEKLQYLKLYDHNPLYTKLVDKIEVKDYVAEKIGVEHIIPTLKVYDDVKSIKKDELPNEFVIKCNHDSSSIIICKEKSDLTNAKLRQLGTNLRRNFYWYFREWAYKNVKPRILVEKYMGDNLTDYKIYCFKGVPRLIDVHFDRHTNHHKSNLYTPDWKLVDGQIGKYPHETKKIINKPKNFEHMLECASKLSEDLKEARIDLYNVDGKIYFGEITLYQGAGLERISPSELDEKLGGWIEL